MKPTIYPAVFHTDEDGKYFVIFPDLAGCLTGGDTFEEARDMAGDALYTWLSAGEDAEIGPIPAPTPLQEVKAEEGAIVLLIKAVPYKCD